MGPVDWSGCGVLPTGRRVPGAGLFYTSFTLLSCVGAADDRRRQARNLAIPAGVEPACRLVRNQVLLQLSYGIVIECVVRMERRVIRGRPSPWHSRSRTTLTLHPGYAAEGAGEWSGLEGSHRTRGPPERPQGVVAVRRRCVQSSAVSLRGFGDPGRARTCMPPDPESGAHPI